MRHAYPNHAWPHLLSIIIDIPRRTPIKFVPLAKPSARTFHRKHGVRRATEPPDCGRVAAKPPGTHRRTLCGCQELAQDDSPANDGKHRQLHNLFNKGKRMLTCFASPARRSGTFPLHGHTLRPSNAATQAVSCLIGPSSGSADKSKTIVKRG